MNRPATIADYVVELDEHLTVGYERRLAILTEVEGHLNDSTRALIGAGAEPDEAEREAIERFGAPRQVAVQYGTDLAGELDERAANALERFAWWRLRHPWVSASILTVVLSAWCFGVGAAFLTRLPSGDPAGMDGTALAWRTAAAMLGMFVPFGLLLGWRWRALGMRDEATVSERARAWGKEHRGFPVLTVIPSMIALIVFDGLTRQDLTTAGSLALIALIPVVLGERTRPAEDAGAAESAAGTPRLAAPERWQVLRDRSRPSIVARHLFAAEQLQLLLVLVVVFSLLGGSSVRQLAVWGGAGAGAALRSLILLLAVPKLPGLSRTESAMAWGLRHPALFGLALVLPYATIVAFIPWQIAPFFVVFFLVMAGMLAWNTYRIRREGLHAMLAAEAPGAEGGRASGSNGPSRCGIG